jgi:hypothetical protein
VDLVRAALVPGGDVLADGLGPTAVAVHDDADVPGPLRRIDPRGEPALIGTVGKVAQSHGSPSTSRCRPLQHAAVLAEARPQELAVGVLAEPVDVEDLRAAWRPAALAPISASARSSRPCCSRRTAASRTGRGAARRPRRRPRRSSPSHRRAQEHAVLQSKASVTSGTRWRGGRRTGSRRSARPSGSSHSGAIDGHWPAGVVKRALGARPGVPRPASSRCPSSRSGAPAARRSGPPTRRRRRRSARRW